MTIKKALEERIVVLEKQNMLLKRKLEMLERKIDLNTLKQVPAAQPIDVQNFCTPAALTPAALDRQRVLKMAVDLRAQAITLVNLIRRLP